LSQHPVLLVAGQVGRDDGCREAGDVFYQRRPETVINEPSRRDYREDAQTVGLRSLAIRLLLEDLHAHKLEGEDGKESQDEEPEVEELVLKRLRLIGDFATIRTPASLLLERAHSSPLLAPEYWE
jgi:hypothetical protein